MPCSIVITTFSSFLTTNLQLSRAMWAIKSRDKEKEKKSMRISCEVQAELVYIYASAEEGMLVCVYLTLYVTCDVI